MNVGLLIFAVYGVFAYLIGGLMFFGAKAHRWRDPWPVDKAFAFAVLWPLCVLYAVCRSLVRGIVTLIKDEVL